MISPITAQEQIFDTRVDTNKWLVSIRTKITMRSEVAKDGTSLLYLYATGDSQKVRINLDIRVPPHLWNAQKQRLDSPDLNHKDINLILDNVDSKITAIKTTYRLSSKHLTLETFKDEFINGIPRVDFLPFAKYEIQSRFKSKIITKSTRDRYLAVIRKLTKFRSRILFSDINHELFSKIRVWMSDQDNKSTTIEANISVVKSILMSAAKSNIPLPIDPEDISVGDTNGDRTDLKPNEVKRLMKFYQSDFINNSYRIVTGYFLFVCFNNLRISELQNIDRAQFHDDYYEYYNKKSKRTERKKINQTTREILERSPELFIEKFSDKHLNKTLKKIVALCGITKKVSFHTGRHTFATNFLRMGGDVISLMHLMGHRDLKTTMIYVHIVNSEANEKMALMDKLLD